MDRCKTRFSSWPCMPALITPSRGTVSANPFQNLQQMADQRVAGAHHLLLAPGKCTLPLDEAKALMASWKAEIGSDLEKFKEKAKVESHCPTAVNGGDLGFLVRSSCSEAFNAILFNEEPGTTYGPIVTPAGLHLIFLASCREPGKGPEGENDNTDGTFGTDGPKLPELPKMELPKIDLPKMPWDN